MMVHRVVVDGEWSTGAHTIKAHHPRANYATAGIP